MGKTLMCISDRLKKAIEAKGLKLKTFQEVTQLPYRSAQSYLNGSREPGAEALTVICTKLCININWLLTGQGEMFIGDPSNAMVAQNSREEALLDNYRHSDSEGRQAVEITASAFARANPKKAAG